MFDAFSKFLTNVYLLTHALNRSYFLAHILACSMGPTSLILFQKSANQPRSVAKFCFVVSAGRSVVCVCCLHRSAFAQTSVSVLQRLRCRQKPKHCKSFLPSPSVIFSRLGYISIVCAEYFIVCIAWSSFSVCEFTLLSAKYFTISADLIFRIRKASLSSAFWRRVSAGLFCRLHFDGASPQVYIVVSAPQIVVSARQVLKPLKIVLKVFCRLRVLASLCFSVCACILSSLLFDRKI